MNIKIHTLHNHSNSNFGLSFLFLVILSYFHQPALAQENPTAARDTLLASQLNNKAIEFAKLKQYDSAIYNFKKAASLFYEASALQQFFSCQSKVGYNLNIQRKYNNALQYLDSIEVNFSNKLDLQFESYQRFYGVLAWSHYKLYQYEKALYYFEMLVVAAEQNSTINTQDRIYAHYYKGVIFQRIGQYDLALKQMTISKEVCLEDSTCDYLGATYNNLGIIYRNLGEYERAADYYKKALDILTKSSKEVSLTPIYNNIGQVYLFLGNYEDALQELNYALEVLTNYTSDYYQVESALVNTKANVLIKQGDFEEAKILLETVYERELKKFGQVGPNSSVTLISLGKIHAKLGNLNISNDYFDQSIRTTQAILGLKNDKSSESFYLKGLNQINAQQYQKALITLQQGIIGLVPDFNKADSKENPSIDLLILDRAELVNLLHQKSNTLLHLYNVTGDINMLERASETNIISTQLIELVRNSLLYENSKIRISKKAKSIYEQSIKIATLLKSAVSKEINTSVLKAMENSKAYMLSDAILKAKSLGYTSDTDSSIQKENRYKTSIKLLESQLLAATMHSKDSTKQSQLKQQLFKIKEDYEDYEQSDLIKAKLKKGLVVPTIRQVQEKLDADKLMVEYFAGDSMLYALAITNNKTRVYELGQYKETLNSLSAKLKLNQKMTAGEFEKVSNNAYSLILKPILNDFHSVKELIIIPDKHISYIPFDALVTTKVANSSFSTLHYLVNELTVYQHQSIGLFINAKVTNNENAYIGFAPNFSAQELSQVKNRELRSSLQPLPFAQKEIESIAQLLDGDIEIGPKASEANFKSSSPNYNILHIASHAVVNEANPLYSKLVFSTGDSLDNEDGNLHSFEIYGLKLTSDLVTLSACNTGTGKYFEGEGVFSLGRAFLMAGAHSVLTSLWEVPDRSTSFIMEAFYKNLKKGYSKPEAIRIAKLTYLKQTDALTANPYYWAGFVYVGTPGIIYKSYKKYYWFIGISLVLLLLVIVMHKNKNNAI